MFNKTNTNPAFDKQGTHLKSRKDNLEWMKSVYSTEEYWSEDLRYGYRWKRDQPVKDYRQTAAFIERYLKPVLPAKVDHALEIGPGGGRWTAELVRIAGRLTLIDLSEPAIAICKERYKYYDNIAYHVGNGSSLSPVEDRSVDLVFSWGVFVHIEKSIISDYLKEIARVLKPTGRAFIQHGALGANVRQSRTNFVKTDMDELAEAAGLLIVAQFMTSKGVYPEHGTGDKPVYLDCNTVLELP